MHRDIKPRNLGIVTLNPPTGVIFDLDDATQDETSADHYKGTLGYLAPEIVTLKAHDQHLKGSRASLSPPPYGRKIDIWALGISAYEIHSGAKLPNSCIIERRFSAITNDLYREAHEDTLEAPYVRLILSMLEWNAEQRMSAAEAHMAIMKLDKQNIEAEDHPTG